jgi:hypothetical protein
MEQTVIILFLILLIIIALNYKKIKYNKFYKNFLNFIKDIISNQIKDLKKKQKHKTNKHKTSKHKTNKHKSKQEENEMEHTMNDDEITIGDILGDQKEDRDNKSNLTDVSSIDLSTLESDKSNDDSVLSFD